MIIFRWKVASKTPPQFSCQTARNPSPWIASFEWKITFIRLLVELNVNGVFLPQTFPRSFHIPVEDLFFASVTQSNIYTRQNIRKIKSSTTSSLQHVISLLVPCLSTASFLATLDNDNNKAKHNTLSLLFMLTRCVDEVRRPGATETYCTISLPCKFLTHLYVILLAVRAALQIETINEYQADVIAVVRYYFPDALRVVGIFCREPVDTRRIWMNRSIRYFSDSF